MNERHTILMNEDQLADFLGVQSDWIVGEVSQGRLPGIQAGARILFDCDAVEDVLIARAQPNPEVNL